MSRLTGTIKIPLDGDEIRRAIRLATTMDDIAVKCVRHVLETIWKVCGAIRSMPDVLVEGIEGRGSGEGGGTRAISFGIDTTTTKPCPRAATTSPTTSRSSTG